MIPIGTTVKVRRFKILKLTGGKVGEVYAHENGKNVVDFANGFHGYYTDDQLIIIGRGND